MSTSGVKVAVVGASVVGFSLAALGSGPATAVATLPALLSLPAGTVVPLLIVSLGFAPLFGTAYLLAATGCVCFLAVTLGRRRGRRSAVAMPLGVFVGFIACSFLWTDAPRRAAIIALLPTLVLLLGTRRWPLSMDKAVKTLVLAGSFQAGLTLLFALREAGRVTESGPFALPMPVVGGVSALGLALVGPKTGRYLVAAALNVLAIIATQTRGMVLGFLVGGLGLLIMARGNATTVSRRRAFSGVILLGGAIVLGLTLTSQGEGRFTAASVSIGAQGRTSELRAAGAEIRRAPLIGHGVGHLFANPIVGSNAYVAYAHNSVVYFALVGGACGAGLYLFIIGIIHRDLRRGGSAGVVASCALLSLIAFSLTAALQRTVHFNVLIALFAGLSAAPAQRDR